MSDVSLTSYPYFCKHTGDDGCGGVAFFMNNKPELGKAMLLSDAINVDGTKIDYYRAVTCGACGEGVRHPRTTDIELRED